MVKDPCRNWHLFVSFDRPTRTAHHCQATGHQQAFQMREEAAGGHQGSADDRFNPAVHSSDRGHASIDLNANDPRRPAYQIDLASRAVYQRQSTTRPQYGQYQSGQARPSS